MRVSTCLNPSARIQKPVGREALAETVSEKLKTIGPLLVEFVTKNLAQVDGKGDIYAMSPTASLVKGRTNGSPHPTLKTALVN